MIPGARLNGVWNRSGETARIFAGLYNTSAWDTVSGMVKNCRSDMVIVCNSHPFHAGPAVEAARSGANILVEKPLASTLSDCDLIIGACEKEGVELGVISQRRWLKPVQRVKEAVDRGKIGKPVLATVNLLGWRDKEYYDSGAWRGTWELEGGGVLVNQAPHHFDLLIWLMGEIEEVYGLWRNYNHPYIEVDDTALAIIKFRNGGTGNLIVSNSQKPGLYGKLHIHGSNGASVGVQTDGGAMFLPGRSAVAEPPVNDLWTVPGEEQLLASWIKEDTDYFAQNNSTLYYLKCQIEDFIKSFSEGTAPLVSGSDGRKVVELFTAIYQSSRDNRPVLFPLQAEKGFDGRG
jgi:predicted dehydrogenase